MSYNVEFQAYFFVISILWGSGILVIYDSIRILRRIIKHSNFFIAIEDILFWIVSSLLIFIMMYKQNNGTIRGFAILGMVMGMIIYNITISKYLVKYISKIIIKLINIILTIVNFILKPLKAFGKIILRLLKKIYKIIKKLHKLLIKRLKKLKKTVRMVCTKK